MSVPHKILLFAAGLFFAVAYIGIASNLFQPGADAAKAAQSDFSNTTSEIKDQKYLVFDNTEISGSQVVNALRRFSKDAAKQSIALYVQTGKNSGSGTWYYNQFASDSVTPSATQNLTLAKDVTSANYINPSGLFESVVERDKNGAIRAVRFVQQ